MSDRAVDGEPLAKRSDCQEENKNGPTVDATPHTFPTAGRNIPVRLGETAIIVIDCQELFWDHATEYASQRMRQTLLPNMQALLQTARNAGVEIVYVVIEALTKNCRDNSLDYKISEINVPKGSPKAQILSDIAPSDDDIIIKKTSCSVFCSTNIDYVLRNLGIRHVIAVGVLTNQCVESAVRDAADIGYLCTLVDDCCAANSDAEHLSALHNLRGFSRIMTCQAMCLELEQLMTAKKSS